MNRCDTGLCPFEQIAWLSHLHGVCEIDPRQQFFGDRAFGSRALDGLQETLDTCRGQDSVRYRCIDGVVEGQQVTRVVEEHGSPRIRANQSKLGAGV